MRDIYELIRQKEAELARLKTEVDALRIAARLLDDAGASVSSAASGTTSPVLSAPPVNRPPAIGSTPSAWASAKQFP